MRSPVIVALAVAWLACLGAPSDARAVGTRTFDLDSLDKMSGGDLQGVTVGSDGVVRAGWTLGSLPLPADAGTTATCALTMADGSVLVGTGPAAGGKVIRVLNDQATVLAETGESAVSALAVDRAGTIYAGTTSNKIYRVVRGKAEVYATLADVDSVFALAIDRGSQALYAATGSQGAVWRIAPGGAPSVYFKADQPFVLALATADDGSVYAGTGGGKGLLYRVTGPGRATVVYDFPGAEVRAVAAVTGNVVLAIANEEPAAAPTEGAEAAARRSAGGRSAPGPISAPRSKAGKGSLWRFDARGRPERLMHHDDFHYLSLAADEHGRPYVGTGAEGRVYTVDDAREISLVADTGERQIAAVGVSGRTRFVLGSDPAVFHRILSVGGTDAVWTSKPLDAGLRARFGRVSWLASGRVEVSTRTGETRAPDSTWSPWSTPLTSGGVASSPAGRFVQVRARLLDPSATLSDVLIPFVTDNLRAVVTEVAARSSAGPHETKEGLPASGTDIPKHEALVHVAWKVDNPDNDELRYRVQFRSEGQTRWIDATRADDVLTKPELDWDTSALPEGKYRLRVDASDEMANSIDDVTHDALVSAPVLVDNTPPSFRTLAIVGRRLRAEVIDGVGPISRVEVALDGRLEWHPVAAADGIFDSASEAVDADLTPLLSAAPGPHLLAVRAYDAAGNFVVRDVATP